MTKQILLINGPNLNLLGTREPHLYGSTTLSDVETSSKTLATSLSASLETFQSNHEGAIVDRIHLARDEKVDVIVINPGGRLIDISSKDLVNSKYCEKILTEKAYTHTSVAIRDALLGVEIPFIELHLTNIHAREAFRHHSYLSDKAQAVIMGLGANGYGVAIEQAIKNIKGKNVA